MECEPEQARFDAQVDARLEIEKVGCRGHGIVIRERADAAALLSAAIATAGKIIRQAISTALCDPV
jgi:hypothetical protein